MALDTRSSTSQAGIPSLRIPFNRATLVGPEIQYIEEAIHRGHIAGDGAFTHRCEALLETELSASRVLLTTSGTHALEMIALLLGIGPGDEVILPSFTFVSTANAFVLRGARPVFADIRPDTLNIDEKSVPGLMSPRTKAIVAVHYAGVGCEMDELSRLGRSAGVPVVEDNAHGLFGRYRDRYLGTIGCLSALSFHETKNFSCGEGGAVVVNDAEYVSRAEVLRQKGTDRTKFLRGEVDKYSWVDLGSSWIPSEILTAFLFAQLEGWRQTQQRRRQLWETYHTGLEGWARQNGTGLPVVPEDRAQSYHMFYLVMPSQDARDGLIRHLKDRGILAVFHYVPLHLSPVGRRLGGKPGDCPVTEAIGGRLVRLPFFTDLSVADQAFVIDAVREVRV
jgi:dTDP-4-amino-4,6-dideoxygalactose transaminase